MLLSAYRPRKCAICTFEVSEWLAPGLFHRSQALDVSQYSRLHRFSTTVATAGGFRQKQRKPKKEHRKSELHPHDPKRSLGKGNFRPGVYRNPDTSEYRSNAVKLDEILNLSQDPHALPPRIRSTSYIQQRASTKYSVFENLVLEQFRIVMNSLKWYSPRERAIVESWGVRSFEEFKAKQFRFKNAISKAFEKVEEDGLTDKENNPLYYRFRRAFIGGDVGGLQREVQYAFMNEAVDLKFSEEQLANQKRIADLRYPVEWFPATRAIQRTIHLHVGPTNSGKTYHALQRLEAAKSGVYAGPLRLLAHEVYTRFNAKGKPCALITGEERRFPENLKAVMNSCTVEMVPLNTKVDVAVIDEIQMIANEERGWAWTQAFLGVQAKEVHLCGETRVVPLIKELCAQLGDRLEIHEYERLSPLETSKKHLGSLSNLEKGDAVVAFSRLAIHGLKSEIEKATGRRCAIVYGSLPPETRAQQASLFNDPDNDYDFLVASDAIGMGLNLAVKRVIFVSTSKRNGVGGFELLDHSSIKQIGGRAGRYKTARDAIQGALTDGMEPESATPAQLSEIKASEPNVGFVTAMEKFDLEHVDKAMRANVEPLKQAGIFPPNSVITRFASFFPPETPFSYILLRLHDLAGTSPHFKICQLKDQIEISDAIQSLPLTINDRLIFIAAPVPARDPGMFIAVRELARCVAEQQGGELLDLKCLNLEILDADMHEYPGQVTEYLRAVETLHRIITLYLWLSYRFTGVFRSQALAFHVKSLVEEKIDLCLQETHWDESARRRSAKGRERLIKNASIKTEGAADDTNIDLEQLLNEDQNEDSGGASKKPEHSEVLTQEEPAL